MHIQFSKKTCRQLSATDLDYKGNLNYTSNITVRQYRNWKLSYESESSRSASTLTASSSGVPFTAIHTFTVSPVSLVPLLPEELILQCQCQIRAQCKIRAVISLSNSRFSQKYL